MEFRTYAMPDLEVRSAAGKRLLCGIVVPYSVDQDIDGRLVERFTPGTFAHQYRAASRVRLLSLHSNVPGHVQLGTAVDLHDDPAGLWGEFRVADSQWGDHYIALAREGMLRQWSVGFTPERSRRDGRVTVHTRANMFETALVPEGAYGELAAIAAVRSAQLPKLTRDTLLAKLPAPHFPA